MGIYAIPLSLEQVSVVKENIKAYSLDHVW